MALTWNDLFFSGSIVHLRTSEWGGKTRIKPADLGIVDSDEVAKALSLGNHRLAPREAFAPIAEIIAKARRKIDYHSMSFGLIKGARFVPSKNMGKLADELRELRTEFDAAVDAFVAGYETTKAEMLPVIEKALRDAAKTEDAAAEAVRRIRDEEYPSASEVRAKFRLIWNVYEIKGPKRESAAAALDEESAMVKDAIRDMLGRLRDEVTEKVADILELVRKGGKLHERSVASIKAMLEHVESVNVMGDPALTTQVVALRRLVDGIATGEQVPADAVTGLEGIKAALEGDIEMAVAAAERNLTAVGRRRLEVA